MSISEFIKGLGGAAAVSKKIPYSDVAIRMWVAREKIPDAGWFELIEAFPEVTAETRKAYTALTSSQTAA